LPSRFDRVLRTSSSRTHPSNVSCVNRTTRRPTHSDPRREFADLICSRRPHPPPFPPSIFPQSGTYFGIGKKDPVTLMSVSFPLFFSSALTWHPFELSTYLARAFRIVRNYSRAYPSANMPSAT
jgi:hypothetical protein